MRICQSCPCLNIDYEDGGSCNLEYTTDLEKEDAIHHIYASKNCRLIKIVTEDKEIFPEEMDDRKNR